MRDHRRCQLVFVMCVTMAAFSGTVSAYPAWDYIGRNEDCIGQSGCPRQFPGAGGVFTDSTYGTRIWQVTDASHPSNSPGSCGNSGGYNPPRANCTHSYTFSSPFSKDDQF